MKKFVKRSLLSLLLTAAMLLTACGSTVNEKQTETGRKVPDVMQLYSTGGSGFSFLYPKGRNVAWDADSGAYVYGGASGEQPYVLICRTDKGGIKPDSYFKDCDKFMLKQFNKVESTPIYQVEVEGKLLYMTRYQCDGITIDRYIEPYRDCYIQYTAISETPDEMNTELYYAIATLQTEEGAYQGAFSAAQTEYTHPDFGITISLPDMLEPKEMTVGYIARGDNAVMLCVYCDRDDTGTPIYNRKDFIDRAAESPTFVADYLGAERTQFSEGEEKEINGQSFYTYPMQMQSGGQQYTGALYLVNAPESGCYMVCYGVLDGCISQNELEALCQSAAESLELP